MSDKDLELAAELDQLKAKADLLGITYHPKIGAVALAEKISQHLNKTEGVEGPSSDDGENTEKPLTKRELILEATKLVRIKITCMNPAKKAWAGEFFSAGNSIIGTYTKYVPYNQEWHVPYIIFKMIKRRKYQHFATVNAGTPRESRRSLLAQEFNIEELPPLTPAELKKLAQLQAMNRGEELED